ncbi:MAG: restriction endonuclease subunit S [Chromatiaceae bacterium]|nr:restriction endonuclease subunit S [Candidatus Thioaporhodococcus sediminis]
MKTYRRPLTELCAARVDIVDPKRDPDREFWYIDISAVDNVTKRITSPQKVIGSQASVRARQLVRTGDVIVATTRPNLNAVALTPDQYNGQICSTGFCVLRPGPELYSEYLFYFVQSGAFIDPLVDLTKGALYPAVTDRQVLNQLIPWVSLNEQHRIATKLAADIATTEQARNGLISQIQDMISLGSAIIQDTLNNYDTKSIALGYVLEEIKKGIGNRWADYPVLGATRDGLAPAKEPVGKNPERYKPVLPGTVFYNPMRILIGSIAMVDEDDPPGITSPDYVILRGKEGLVDSRWFYYWLRSPAGERCIASLARGAVRERMLFNRLAEGEINLPPYSVQLAASQALAELRPLKHGIEARLRDIELLPARILANAFDLKEDSSHA